MTRSPTAVLTLAATLSGCGLPVAGGEAGHAFSGTRWALQAILSMDDSQGTTRVEDPSRFTIEFGRDGQATFRLDCNRGQGSWQARAAGADTGSLGFGPIAATRALCPPPRLDERIVRDRGYVRSYLLRDGRLFMSLMADGGIYEWRRIDPAR